MTDTDPALIEVRTLLYLLICELVDQPELVSCVLAGGVARTRLYELHVAQPDVRRIIGKSGKTMNAVREVTRVIGGRLGRNLLVDVIEPSSPGYLPYPDPRSPRLDLNAEEAGRAREMLERLLAAMVDRPQDVRVGAVEGTSSTILEARVAGDDVRRIIGRGGRTAEALRALLLAMGGRHKRRYALEIVEPEGRSTRLSRR